MTEDAKPTRNSRVAAMSCTVSLATVMIALPLGTVGLLLLLPILIVTTLAALLLATPTYLAARSLGIENGWTAALGGAFTGGVAAIILTLPGPTWSLWRGTASLAIGGAAAGIFFYLHVIWPQASRRHRMRWGGAVIGLVAAAYALLLSGYDWSCHNPTRWGYGVGPSDYFSIDARRAPWREVAAEVERFAHGNGWSVRRDTRGNIAANWYSLSICKASGTLIQLYSDAREIEVIVYEPQGGDGWIAPARELHARLARRWPGAMAYHDALGNDTSAPPAWLAGTNRAPSSAAR